MDTQHNQERCPGLVIVGNDTDAGKTLVSAILMRYLKGTYWKPIQSGALEGRDTMSIQQLTGLPSEHFLDEAYVFQEVLSPNQAAEIEGVSIEVSKLALPIRSAVKHHPLIVETAGGIMVPVNKNTLNVDLIAAWGLPVVIVCRNRLGVINHMLLTISELKRRNVKIFGFISSGGNGNPQSLKDIEKFGEISLIGTVPEMSKIDVETIGENMNKIDCASLEISIGR